MPEFVQPDVEIADALVDPGVVAAGLRRGAAGDDGLEGGIDGDGKGVGAHGAPASRDETRKPSSGITPRISGSTQNRVGSSALSAIGKMPQA